MKENLTNRLNNWNELYNHRNYFLALEEIESVYLGNTMNPIAVFLYSATLVKVSKYSKAIDFLKTIVSNSSDIIHNAKPEKKDMFLKIASLSQELIAKLEKKDYSLPSDNPINWIERNSLKAQEKTAFSTNIIDIANVAIESDLIGDMSISETDYSKQHVHIVKDNEQHYSNPFKRIETYKQPEQRPASEANQNIYDSVKNITKSSQSEIQKQQEKNKRNSDHRSNHRDISRPERRETKSAGKISQKDTGVPAVARQSPPIPEVSLKTQPPDAVQPPPPPYSASSDSSRKQQSANAQIKNPGESNITLSADGKSVSITEKQYQDRSEAKAYQTKLKQADDQRQKEQQEVKNNAKYNYEAEKSKPSPARSGAVTQTPNKPAVPWKSDVAARLAQIQDREKSESEPQQYHYISAKTTEEPPRGFRFNENSENTSEPINDLFRVIHPKEIVAFIFAFIGLVTGFKIFPIIAIFLSFSVIKQINKEKRENKDSPRLCILGYISIVVAFLAFFTK